MDAEGSAPTARWKALAGWTAAVLALAWRVLVVPPSQLWRDAVVLLVLVWGLARAVETSRRWPLVLAGLTAFLLGIYAQGQVPHALRALGILR